MIIITADDYFELFVNGMLLHAAVPGIVDAWATPRMFRVPLREGLPLGGVTYAVRAVNENNAKNLNDTSPNAAGFRAAIQIDFASSAVPVILNTVVGEGWRSSHIFGSGWEQPGFDDGDWELAKAMPTIWRGTNDPVWDVMNEPSKLHVAKSLPPSGVSIGAPTPSDPLASGLPASPSEPPSNLARQQGEVSGLLVGAAFSVFLFSFVFSWLLLRLRRFTSTTTPFDSERRRTPKRPLTIRRRYLRGSSGLKVVFGS